jgi:uncharacterized protein (TIGR03435 family)
MVRPLAGGRFVATNLPLRVLVRMAYGVRDFQIVGGPSWLASGKFDIAATAPPGSPVDTPATMARLKTLLADRFKLRVHTETREMPVYALVVARSDGALGPDLKPSASDCSNAAADAQKRAEDIARGGAAAIASIMKPGAVVPCSIMPAIDPARPGAGFGLRANGQPMSLLTQLVTEATGRIVHDQTGLTGLYDFELRFDPETLMRLAAQAGLNLPAIPGVSPLAANSPFADSPSLMTALREQLGLRLDARRGPVEVLVIDGVEMPEPD